MNIADAVKQFTRHVRQFSYIMVVDTADRDAPTPEQLATHQAQVESLCGKLDALTEGAPTFKEFDAIRQQLYSINAVAPLGHLRDVEDAFIAARRL